MTGYAKLYTSIRKITDIVTLGMQNESCKKYLDFQKVTGRAFKGICNLTRGRIRV